MKFIKKIKFFIMYNFVVMVRDILWDHWQRDQYRIRTKQHELISTREMGGELPIILWVVSK